MQKSKNFDSKPQGSNSPPMLPKLPEELRKRILNYIEDYMKSKKERIH